MTDGNPARPVMMADKVQVFDLMHELKGAFEKYADAQAAAGRQLAYLDAFMGVHNFHKLVVQDLADRSGFKGVERKIFFQMARDTWTEALDDLIKKAG